MNIEINGKDVELKATLRAFMMYENINGKDYKPEGITDVLTFVYCVIVASSKDYSYTFELFLDEMDSNPDLMTKVAEWINTTMAQNALLKKK